MDAQRTLPESPISVLAPLQPGDTRQNAVKSIGNLSSPYVTIVTFFLGLSAVDVAISAISDTGWMPKLFINCLRISLILAMGAVSFWTILQLRVRRLKYVIVGAIVLIAAAKALTITGTISAWSEIPVIGGNDSWHPFFRRGLDRLGLWMILAGFLLCMMELNSLAVGLNVEGTLLRNEAEISARELASARERLTVLFQNSPDACFLCSADRTVIDCNPTAARIAERSVADVIGTRLAQIFADPGDRSKLKLPHASAPVGGSVASWECNVAHRTGQLIFEVSVFPVEWSVDELVLVIARDVTLRHRAEAALREASAELECRVAERTAAAEERAVALARSEAALRRQTEILESILNSMGDGVIVADATGHTVLLNRAAEQLHGFGKTQIPQERWADAYGLFLPDGRTPFPTADLPLARALRGEVTDDAVIFIRSSSQPDGAFISVTGRPIQRNGAAGQGGVVVLRDITSRQQGEAALRESEERFRSAFNNTPIGMSLMAPDGRFLRVNRSLCEIVGYSESELLAMDFQSITHPDDLDVDLNYARQMVDGTIRNYQMEKRYFHKEGHIVDILLTVSMVRDTRGMPLHFIKHIQDVTERKKAERQIGASLHEKEVLLKEIHHRVKNNLQVVSTLLYLQSRYSKDPTTAEMFQESQHRVRAMALVHERLYRSKDLASVEFTDYIANLANDLFRSYHVDSDGISLDIDAHKVDLSIDSAVPCGLLVNELISNSLKHAFVGRSNGAIRISLLPKNPGEFLFQISDDGIGLPADVNPGATGSFGLQLVADLVAQLHGSFEIERTNGTTFSITFPTGNASGVQSPELSK